MTDLLSVAASGLRAYQTALSTTSDNIANAATPGYVRRTANVREITTVSGYVTGATGLGVAVNGISRAGDLQRSAEVRSASADLARTKTGAAWLGEIEDALSANKLSDRLTSFFTSAKAVAADPSALAPRSTMLEAASGVAVAFSATGSALSAAATGVDQSGDAATAELNNLTAGLAQVNAGLARAQDGSAGQAALLDQRDQLLEQMSAITDVSVNYDGYGRATVRGGGAAGPVLVEGISAARVAYARNDEGAVSYSVTRDGAVSLMHPNGGALAGIVDGAQRIAAAQQSLDQIASDFATQVNGVQAGGRDLAGNPGAPMFAIGDPPSQLTLALDDPRGIAAAAAGGGVRDNSNLAALDALRTSGGYEDKVTDLVASNGAALSGRNTVAEAQSAIRDAAVAQRDSVSGVNVDEEAVDLMRFQQAYQASAHAIQVARDTLQSILDIR